jgi:hypothetical protein
MIIAIGFASYIKRSLPPASLVVAVGWIQNTLPRRDAVNFGHH